MDAPTVETAYNSYIFATVAQTKAIISDDYVKVSWDKKDTLSVYTSKGRFVDFVYDIQVEQDVVRFKGELEDGEVIDRYAVFPAGEHVVSDDQLMSHPPARPA